MRTALSRTLVIAAISSTLASCGHEAVKMYDGEQQSDDKIQVLWTNPHLVLSVDRQYTVPDDKRAKLMKIELPMGHHLVEARCLYTKDVLYHPAGGGPAGPPPESALKFTMSPIISLLVDGEPGHRHKPRVHFSVNEQGLPGCKVKLFDVTDESGGQNNDFY
jgi:hypothetical protein